MLIYTPIILQPEISCLFFGASRQQQHIQTITDNYDSRDNNTILGRQKRLCYDASLAVTYNLWFFRNQLWSLKHVSTFKDLFIFLLVRVQILMQFVIFLFLFSCLIHRQSKCSTALICFIAKIRDNVHLCTP